jgi:hypothetical protein
MKHSLMLLLFTLFFSSECLADSEFDKIPYWSPCHDEEVLRQLKDEAKTEIKDHISKNLKQQIKSLYEKVGEPVEESKIDFSVSVSIDNFFNQSITFDTSKITVTSQSSTRQFRVVNPIDNSGGYFPIGGYEYVAEEVSNDFGEITGWSCTLWRRGITRDLAIINAQTSVRVGNFSYDNPERDEDGEPLGYGPSWWEIFIPKRN